MSPLNRTCLLDFLQKECERLNFRRETYYLAQCYVDGYLDKETPKTTEMQLLAYTCLHIAMKIEEVDLVSLKDIMNVGRGIPPLFLNF